MQSLAATALTRLSSSTGDRRHSQPRRGTGLQQRPDHPPGVRLLLVGLALVSHYIEVLSTPAWMSASATAAVQTCRMLQKQAFFLVPQPLLYAACMTINLDHVT